MSVRHFGPIALSGALALAAWPAQAQQAPAAATPAPAAATPAPAAATPAPAAATPAPAAATAPQKDQPRTGTDWHLLGAFTAYTLAAAAVGTFAFSYMRGDELNSDAGLVRYRNGPFPGATPSDVCVAARNGVVVQGAPSPAYVANVCSQSDTLKTVSIVSAVTAILGAGAGTALLLTRPSTKQAAMMRAPRLALTPVIGVHGASAQLDYRF